MIDLAGTAERACQLSLEQLRGVEGLGAAKARDVYASLHASAATADEELSRAADLGVGLLCAEDESYPAALHSIHDPPAVLYVRGTLEPRDLNAVAVVGSRKCSHYGREQADRFSALLAGAGYTVISGGARGVDSAAHRGALAHPHGRTIAVLGCGVDVAYPPENEAFFKEIATRGAILSEFPLGTPPNRENFPRRNRIVAAMSRGVLIIEADVRSGALITARLAADDYGKPVMALPGRLDNPLSAGPHQLIRDGATLVTSLEDIVCELSPVTAAAIQTDLFIGGDPVEDAALAPSPKPEAAPAISLSDRQRSILASVESAPTAVDQIIERTGLDASSVLQELTLMSLRGLLKRVDGQSYARVGRN